MPWRIIQRGNRRPYWHFFTRNSRSACRHAYPFAEGRRPRSDEHPHTCVTCAKCARYIERSRRVRQSA